MSVVSETIAQAGVHFGHKRVVGGKDEAIIFCGTVYIIDCKDG